MVNGKNSMKIDLHRITRKAARTPGRGPEGVVIVYHVDQPEEKGPLSITAKTLVEDEYVEFKGALKEFLANTGWGSGPIGSAFARLADVEPGKPLSFRAPVQALNFDVFLDQLQKPPYSWKALEVSPEEFAQINYPKAAQRAKAQQAQDLRHTPRYGRALR